jgi:predicted ester cyclase
MRLTNRIETWRQKMNHDNRSIFHRLVDEGINGRNLGVFDDLLAPDILDHDLPPGTPRGPAGTKAKLGAFIEGFPDLKLTFEAEAVEGDLVAGRGYITGTHRGVFNGIAPTGKSVKVPFMDFWRFENGRVAEYWGRPDLLGLLQQLGVIASP